MGLPTLWISRSPKMRYVNDPHTKSTTGRIKVRKGKALQEQYVCFCFCCTPLHGGNMDLLKEWGKGKDNIFLLNVRFGRNNCINLHAISDQLYSWPYLKVLYCPNLRIYVNKCIVPVSPAVCIRVSDYTCQILVPY